MNSDSEKHPPSEERSDRSSWFPMRRGEAPALAFLVLFSIVSFLPPWREIKIGGMVLFGWLMALLMLLSPALMLVVFRRTRDDDRGPSDRDSA